MEPSIQNITWQAYGTLVHRLAKQVRSSGREYDNVYGVPRGGLPAAVGLSHALQLPLIVDERELTKRTLVVDDIADSGKTLTELLERAPGVDTAVLHKRYTTTHEPTHYAQAIMDDAWINYPWENVANETIATGAQR